MISCLKKFAGRIYGISLILVVLPGCHARELPGSGTDPLRFSAYWYQGKAEVSSYALTQARYGQAHDGKAVLIFVTEDLDTKTQVKLDPCAARSAKPVKVMKLNTLREFVTGLYDYRMMSSVFTPVRITDEPHSLKVVTSTQDWCGQTFLQANWKGNRYDLNGFSYFENEGDTQGRLKAAWLEDEVWTRIRIDPSSLPQKEIEITPGFVQARLEHRAPAVEKAYGALMDKDSSRIYTLRYSSIARELEIEFEKAFPHRILRWRETDNGQSTSAVLINTLVTAYWMQNTAADEVWRDRLNLVR